MSFLKYLKRHPFPVVAWFERVVAVSFSSHELGEKSAQLQTNARKPRFKITIPMAEIKNSPAKEISSVFIAMMAAVWTTAQGTGCHPVKAQTPRSTSSRPIVFVA